ncbi:MAG: S41 family peptidase [Victivallaceae bacterium]|nr:S41 family peptidase [Victivallaceae bacterium]
MRGFFPSLTLISGLLSLLLPATLCGGIEETQSLRLATDPKKLYAQVFQTVASLHYRGDFAQRYRGLYEKHLPAVALARTDAELSAAINGFLGAIGDSHLLLLPPPEANAGRAMRVFVTGKVEAEVVLARTNDGIFVVSAPAGSPLRAGDQLLSVGGHKIAIRETVFPSWSVVAKNLLNSGAPGPIRVEVLRGGKNMTFALPRSVGTGVIFSSGELLNLALFYHAKMLDSRIAMIRFNAFTPDVIKFFRRDLKEKFKDAEALVIDLRGNVGGLVEMARWLGAWTSPRELDFGRMTTRGKVELRFKSVPQRGAFTGPVALLIDKDSYSTAEIFAAGMADGKRARLFGERTSGWCLPSILYKLPGGYRLQCVFGDIRRPRGDQIEHHGVTPDAAIAYAPGRDAVLEGAVAYLRRELDKARRGGDKENK